MSFANEVREEIVRRMVDRDKQFACLYGIVLYNRALSAGEIVFQTESPVTAAFLPHLFHNVLHCPLEQSKSGGTYTMKTTSEEQAERVCSAFHIDPQNRTIRPANLGGSAGAFLAGVFFSCGSIADPNVEYHLEFHTPTERLCTDLSHVLRNIAVKGKRATRRGSPVLYIKNSEQIEDTLTFMGAQQCTIDLMNIKIRKDMRNKANRLRNCDEANINKMVSAAMRQTATIRYLKERGELEKMPQQLQDLALLRLENPDLTLQELGEMLSPPLGRSGVYHRFQKIAAIAQELQKRENGS